MLFLALLCLTGSVTAKITGPLTNDFQTWLTANNYGSYDFVRSDDGTQGSYGGKTANADKVVNTPVIFIHGNSDSALSSSKSATGWDNSIEVGVSISVATGWDNSIEYFLSQGYTTAELYATSWGDTNALKAESRTHSCHDIQRWRAFIQAVLDYTGAPKVSVVTHSMGVTLGRKAIKGGSITATDGTCNIGDSIASKVDVYVGLAGANYGLCTCEGTGTLEPTCNTKNGLWPGDKCGANAYTCGLTPLTFPCDPSTIKYSDFLTAMNNDPTPEGAYVFSVWSASDNLILYGDQVWGRPTSLMPTSTGSHTYLSYTHMETKEKTAADQYTMVALHKLPA